MGGNLGRDGDVEVAQAQALPVEAVEPPAISQHMSDDARTSERRRRRTKKWNTTKNGAVSVSSYFVCSPELWISCKIS